MPGSLVPYMKAKQKLIRLHAKEYYGLLDKYRPISRDRNHRQNQAFRELRTKYYEEYIKFANEFKDQMGLKRRA